MQEVRTFPASVNAPVILGTFVLTHKPGRKPAAPGHSLVHYAFGQGKSSRYTFSQTCSDVPGTMGPSRDIAATDRNLAGPIVSLPHHTLVAGFRPFPLRSISTGL
jgi:hypothetical protein